MDGFLGVIGFEKEKLGHYGCGHALVDFAIETDDTFLHGQILYWQLHPGYKCAPSVA